MITVANLSKLYSNGKGIKDVSFEIQEGEVFGYLGPNGAGKTTTIRNLLGFLKPDSGNCSIHGFDCWGKSEEIKKDLGYIPGELAFFDGMTGTSFLDFLQDMRRIRDRVFRNDLIERFDFDPSAKIRKMSKGMKQKLGIVAACMHDPSVYVMDEPSSGLDPLMQDRFVNFVLEEKNRGKTILMSSHSFDEIDRCCDRAGIIREGRLVDIQDISELKKTQLRNYIVTLSDEKDISKLEKANLHISERRGRRLTIGVKGDMDAFLKTIASVTVENLEVQASTLETVFMQYYGTEV